MEMVFSVKKWGNGGGVLLPREWVGKEIGVVLIDRTSDIKKEVLTMLYPYLSDIIGIYLTGSYARNEQTEDSDIDLIAISNETRKEIVSGKYHLIITTLSGVKKGIKNNPILIYPRLIEAKALMNESLLKELLSIKPTKASFREFIIGTKSIIKINRELLELDKLDGEQLESDGVIYSIVLRLRGVFLMECILEGKKYFKKHFREWMLKNISDLSEEEYDKLYDAYNKIKTDKKVKLGKDFSLNNILRVVDFLEKEVNRYAK